MKAIAPKLAETIADRDAKEAVLQNLKAKHTERKRKDAEKLVANLSA